MRVRFPSGVLMGFTEEEIEIFELTQYCLKYKCYSLLARAMVSDAFEHRLIVDHFKSNMLRDRYGYPPNDISL